MTEFSASVEDVKMADVEPKGIYFFKGASPAEAVEKFDEYEGGKGIEGTEYKAIQLFMVANKQAIYDSDRNLVEVRDVSSPALNCFFKMEHPDGLPRKNGVAKFKSWWMTSFGAYPPNNGKTYDWDAVMAELHNGEGWGSIQHFETTDNETGEDKIIAYVGNRFSKEPPKKAPK